MKIYLAGENQKKHIIPAVHGSDNVQVFLAGVAPWKEEGLYDEEIKKHKPYILESFFYVDEDTERLLPLFGDFMLDSGAFTFMQGKVGELEWDDYIERYADFINRNNVEKFFELDIDSVVGYEKVLQYRNRLESLAGKRCIPVWHNSRGKDEFEKMCKEYDYVAIGGLVGGSSEYSKEYWKYFPWFINMAHKNDAKIHALGFTSLAGIEQYHFDSVDSTAWTAGNRFGYVYKFDGKTLRKFDVPKGKRLADSRAVALNNYVEWIKFQKYAEVHL